MHASCVDVAGNGLLITGGSGSGKSTLALQLMAFGAALVSDDKVIVAVNDQGLEASAPEALHGMIEARGVGLLRASACSRSRLTAVVDLEQLETDRLPPQLETMILNQPIRLLRRVDGPQFAPALIQLLKYGSVNPDA
ncbi:HPr kinase/phosphatase C-terminal domain-containing protein [Phaeobacter inhibens]|nr:HPr kinase/phosphatase C-terminal domain-containing protein [Phaeobacter inhibens]UWR66477.1 HPr kinase/phosphatase C-terminal domain-containing protein [Phaeobacter inhibens]UWR70386.1 HPr kinase/phosphatase C-terminal domain-containing protein [Phaeobacter inhibens]UWR98010.1 HPr kinase/phosphatase C-terminal domain-containing protein [Phaeobacter inhibens]UWS02035.1 HPr kinase/phosphatase C-terminal domain-containing protein [Phaeobacter inhibens]